MQSECWNFELDERCLRAGLDEPSLFPTSVFRQEEKQDWSISTMIRHHACNHTWPVSCVREVPLQSLSYLIGHAETLFDVLLSHQSRSFAHAKVWRGRLRRR